MDFVSQLFIVKDFQPAAQSQELGSPAFCCPVASLLGPHGPSPALSLTSTPIFPAGQWAGRGVVPEQSEPQGLVRVLLHTLLGSRNGVPLPRYQSVPLSYSSP